MFRPLVIASLIAALGYAIPLNSTEQETYLNTTHAVFKVLRIFPDNLETLKILHELREHEDEYNLDFWKAPRNVGQNVDIMVPPEYSDAIPDLLNLKNISYNTIIPDVEEMIKTTEKRVFAPGMDDTRQRDEASTKVSFNFRGYNSYGDMVRYMKYLSDIFPEICKFLTIGKTHEGRYIHGLKIGYPLNESKKRMVYIDGGMHAREWAAGHSVMFFIHQLISQYKRDKEIKMLVDNLTWYIFPMVNPDGYEHSRSSSIPNIRMWRKNREPGVCYGTGPRAKCCKGVDLNRNFDWHWGETDTSDNPCSIIYGGKSAMSEPESKAVGNFVMKRRSKIDMFITVHTYGQLWLHAFGHSKNSYPPDVKEVAAVGKRAAYSLSKVYGTKFETGSGADVLYPSSGGSDDWAKGKAKIKYTYLLELRPDGDNMAGFILREDQLLPTSIETWEGIKVVAKRVILRARKLLKLKSRSKGPRVEQQRRSRTRASLNSARKSSPRENMLTRWPSQGPVRQRDPSAAARRAAADSARRAAARAEAAARREDARREAARRAAATQRDRQEDIIEAQRLNEMERREKATNRRTKTLVVSRPAPPSIRFEQRTDTNAAAFERNQQTPNNPPRRATFNTRRPFGSEEITTGVTGVTAAPLTFAWSTTETNAPQPAAISVNINTQIQPPPFIQPTDVGPSTLAPVIIGPPTLPSVDITASTNFESNIAAVTVQSTIAELSSLTDSAERIQGPSRGFCEDTEPHCQTWIENNPNLCYVSRVSMRDQCSKSCGFC